MEKIFHKNEMTNHDDIGDVSRGYCVSTATGSGQIGVTVSHGMGERTGYAATTVYE